jgi:hypothetical protein
MPTNFRRIAAKQHNIHKIKSQIILALGLIAAVGLLGVIVFGWNSVIDWNALQSAYVQYKQIADSPADMRTLSIAEAEQNIHRINLLAEGVWTLLSTILCALGVCSICICKAIAREAGTSSGSARRR